MAEAVRLERPADGVAVVAMEDRAGRNTFTEALVAGLAEAFEAIRAAPDLRVVVVHGYDSVFCAGGTQEELLDIADGRRAFDEGGFFRLLLDCELPVVAAMQGHALGGGLVFGLYADLVVLSEESLYAANFMRYGFTPGMGATLLVPEKLGAGLGVEMLFTANGYHGGTLRQRGVGFPVVPRGETVPHALKLARDLADKPRTALVELKRATTSALRAALPEVVAREMRMHEVTFAEPEVRERIETRFGR